MKIMTSKELMKPFTSEQKEQLRAQETSYRRGYRHAYSQALDDVQRGTPMNRLYSFFNKELMQWTYFKDTKSREGETTVFPPVYIGVRKNEQ